jgi:hypothetical protein
VATRSKPALRVVRHYAPDLERQVQALLLVLGRAKKRQEKQQSQDQSPGTATEATAVTTSDHTTRKRAHVPVYQRHRP